MVDHVYKTVELTGSSPTSSDDAVKIALNKAAQTIRNLRWFEILETRGSVEPNGQISSWQVTIKVGFTIED